MSLPNSSGTTLGDTGYGQRARTIKEAFQSCNVGPLYGDSLKFYSELDELRGLEAIQTVNTELDFLEPGQFETLLFTGHRGCGKSTELRKLAQRWNQDYRVLYFEVDEQIDVNDADYTDLYLLLIKQVSDDLVKLKLDFDPQLLQGFQSWFMAIMNETGESIENSVSLKTSTVLEYEVPLFSRLIIKLLAQIKGSHGCKQQIREILQSNAVRLQEEVNKLLRNAFAKVQQNGYPKGLLLLVDNLDRVSIDVARRLYFERPGWLHELDCTVVWTAPVYILYSGVELNDLFKRPNILPMANIYDFVAHRRELNYNEIAVKQFGAVIEKRIDTEAVFFDQGLVASLVKASGGHLRQLIAMTANACLVAASRKHQQVMNEDVDYAIRQHQFSFERSIPSSHYPMLVRVCETKHLEQNEDIQTVQEMLGNTSVLEYGAALRWHYANPLIRINDCFQEATKASLGKTLASEDELLKAIAESIPLEMQTRCDELFEKRESVGLNAEEENEIHNLTNQMEMLNAQRILRLSQLAQLRSVSLDEVIQQVSPMLVPHD